MYLEESRMDDAYDTGICDAVHNAEPKVGRNSRTPVQLGDMFNTKGGL